MRYILALLILLMVLPSCHTRRKAMRRREEATREARADEQRNKHKGGNTKHGSDNKATAEQYIASFKGAAINQMRKFGIPASITLAQGILESANGNSELARQANNHFGIKCTSDWKGKTYYHAADGGNNCFRKYPSVEASYRDHAEFLKHKRYADLFDLRPDDYKGWARGLKRDGYATNPKYPQLLINLIEKYNLYQYD